MTKWIKIFSGADRGYLWRHRITGEELELRKELNRYVVYNDGSEISRNGYFKKALDFCKDYMAGETEKPLEILS